MRKPVRLRMNTSQSGLFFSVICPFFGSPPFLKLRCIAHRGVAARLALLRISHRGLAHPGAIIVGLPAPFHALAIAGTIALNDALEFGPVDLAEFPMLGLFVELSDQNPGMSDRDNVPAAPWHRRISGAARHW